MSDADYSSTPAEFEELDSICDRFEAAWKSGEFPRLEDFLACRRTANSRELFRALLALELDYRHRSGDPPSPVDYLLRFPEFADVVQDSESHFRDRSAPSSGANGKVSDHELAVGARVGRYEIQRRLDAGSFGTVYVGRDTELGRRVAIKLAHAKRQSEYQDLLMLEPKLAARFEHPHIVPVYDVGRLPDGRPFIISQFIEGTTLKAKLDFFRTRPHQAAELISKVATALHYAHQKAVIHRDVKPANILLDRDLKPYLTDFGLAMPTGAPVDSPGLTGTPAYMSPEQARGEIHLVDERSDVFSLSAVFYEIVTVTRPFSGCDQFEVLKQVREAKVVPPRQLHERVPRELERIILKGLQKQARLRYQSAEELAEDLNAWLEEGVAKPAIALLPRESHLRPPGLAPFTASDSAYFRRLIPGTRAKNDLPESIAFWRQRIESRGEAEAFRIGVLYGPSGSGKSSFVKAGLLPCLRDVVCCFVQATPTQTPQSLRDALHVRFPGLEHEPNLVAMMRHIRTGGWLDGHQKLLIVVDQFEQWLNAQSDFYDSELTAALRQCNGIHTQALFVVRDDFWGPLTRCMHALDLELDRDNHRLVDPFDVEHAKTVLLELGRGYGCLPKPAGRQEPEVEFAEAVIHEMTLAGPLIPIRLSLFAHAVRDRPWTTKRLSQAAGVQGVIRSFIDELLDQDKLLCQNQESTIRILQALLPPSVSLIKDKPKTPEEISEISGIPRDTCRQLLQALEHRSPLVTTVESEPEIHHVQLAHDHLVPIVRDWTNRRLGATRRGRAESLLRERAEAWSARQNTRSLPSLPEWLTILALGRGAPWNSAARSMMRRATLRYLTILAMLALTATTILGLVRRNSRHRTAAHLAKRLEDATTSEVSPIIEDCRANASLVNPLLTKRLAELESSGHLDAASCRRLLHLHLALIGEDPDKHVARVGAFAGALPDTSIQYLPRPTDLSAIYEVMAPHVGMITDDLERIVSSVEASHTLRLRAASALAQTTLPARDGTGSRAAEQIVKSLTESPPIELAAWIPLLEPLKHQLLPALQVALRQRTRQGTETTTATLLAAYGSPEYLVDAIADATPPQIHILSASLDEQNASPLLFRRFLSLGPTAKSKIKVDVDTSQASRTLGDFHGAAAACGAFAQAVPEEQIARVIDQMESCGFCPNTFRPYRFKDQLSFAMTWEPGVQPHHRQTALTPTSFPETHQQLSDQGYELIDVTGYEHGSQQLFAALWTLPMDRQNRVRTEVYLDQPAAVHVERLQEYPDQGLRPVRIFTRMTPIGTKHYSVIWKLLPAEERDYVQPFAAFGLHNPYLGYLMRDCQIFLPRHSQRSTDQYLAKLVNGISDSEFEEFRELARADDFEILRHHPRFSRALREAEHDVLAARVWTDTLDLQSQLLVSRNEEHHYVEGERYLAAGLIPISISVRYTEAADHVALASVWHQQITSEAATEQLASRRANTAIAMLLLGDGSPLHQVLSADFGDQAASYAVHRLADAGASVEQILMLAKSNRSDTLLQNVLLALAECRDRPTYAVARFLGSLNSDNPAIISAVRYCARKLDLPPPELKSKWVNSIGAMMIPVTAPPDRKLLLGSPSWQRSHDPKAVQRIRRIDRDFALAATEVTKEQFDRFLACDRVRRYYNRNGREAKVDLRYSKSQDCPRIDVTYFDAVLFCQWLSEEEHIPKSQQCYPGIWGFDEGTYRMPDDAFNRSGYRLPTEPEWELACRAGSSTSRHYGSADAMIESYAWGIANSENQAHPVASLRPNQLGFFDMMGNVAEWCHEPYLRFDQPLDPSHLLLSELPKRVIRGGTFQYYKGKLHTAYRMPLLPTIRNPQIGFRPAKTLIRR